MAVGTLDAITWALDAVADPGALFLLIVGAMIGVLIGAIPGLGAVTTLALLIPISFTFEKTNALLFLIGGLGGVNFGGSIPAILLNIPGTAPSVMTTVDGYQLSVKDRAAEALGASAAASAVGAAFGVVFLFAAIPLFRQILFLFGPPEFLLVALVGLLAIVYVLQGSVVNGIAGAGIGMAMAFHGFENVTGGLRFDFGIGYLYDGVPLVALVLGLYAIAEMIDLTARRQTIAGDPTSVEGNPLTGVIAVWRNLALTIKSGVYGIIFGFIPGAGATTAVLVSYARAKATLPDGDLLGTGDIRGVIAPEGANDAKDGGALLPTIAFGVPGTPAHAVLLGGLLLHGITPGPAAFTDQLNFVYLLVFGLLLANVFTSTLGLVLAKQFVRVTTLRSSLIVAPVIMAAMVGAYAVRTNPLDMLVALFLGILGYGALRFDMSRIAILFGLILGPLIEKTFHQTLQITEGDYLSLFARPAFTGILLLVMLVILYLMVLRQET